MMGSYGMGMGPGGWVFMGLFWVLLVGAIVWLIAELVRSGNRHDTTAAALLAPPTGFGPASATAVDVLDRRLAAGETDLAAYQPVRAALGESGGAR